MKKIFIILIMALALALPARAQVFVIYDEESDRTPEDAYVFAILPAEQGIGLDWYAPIGDGLLLLTALGGAYLLRKKTSEQQ